MSKNPTKTQYEKFVSVEEWTAADHSSFAGILIDTKDDIESLASILNQAPLIAFDFSNFDNGVNYSQIKLLKQRINYQGKIKAINVHIDHLQFILRSGVDSYELLPEYKQYKSDYALDFSVCYQEAENNIGLLEKHKIK